MKSAKKNFSKESRYDAYREIPDILRYADVVVKAALSEYVGKADITTEAVVGPKQVLRVPGGVVRGPARGDRHPQRPERSHSLGGGLDGVTAVAQHPSESRRLLVDFVS